MPFQVKVQYGMDFLKNRTFVLSNDESWTYVQFRDKILETIAPFLSDLMNDEIRISYSDDKKDFVTMNSSLYLQDELRYAEPIPKTENLSRLCVRVQQSPTPIPQNYTSVERRASFSKKSLGFGVSAQRIQRVLLKMAPESLSVLVALRDCFVKPK